MKFREFITAFTLIILLALLLCIVYARAPILPNNTKSLHALAPIPLQCLHSSRRRLSVNIVEKSAGDPALICIL